MKSSKPLSMYILGEYHGSEERSTMGRMGDIKGRPSKEGLEKIKQDSERLARRVSVNSENV